MPEQDRPDVDQRAGQLLAVEVRRRAVRPRVAVRPDGVGGFLRRVHVHAVGAPSVVVRDAHPEQARPAELVRVVQQHRRCGGSRRARARSTNRLGRIAHVAEPVGGADHVLWLPAPAAISPTVAITRAIDAIRSVSSSRWFAGGNVDDGGCSPWRATIRRASQGAIAPIRNRFANELITSAGTNSALPAVRRQPVRRSARRRTVSTRNSGQRHAPISRQRSRRAQNRSAVLTRPG